MSWSAGKEVEIRIVTEDAADDAHETVTHLLRRMLRIIEPSFATNRLNALPMASSEGQRAAQPHRWHSRNDEDRRLMKSLARAIATDLQAARFVVLHADGDSCWSDRPSKYGASFRDNLLPVVKAALASATAAPRRPDQPRQIEATQSADALELYLRRIVRIMPYYTIESWLYQNTTVAVRICREKYQGRDVEKFERWGYNRAQLDDEIKELQNVPLQKKHNLELAASGYPATEVYEARASFHAAVEQLRGCGDLCAALGMQ